MLRAVLPLFERERDGSDVLQALRRIAAGQARFVSRGDDAGTDPMERSYWEQLGISARGAPWHICHGTD